MVAVNTTYARDHNVKLYVLHNLGSSLAGLHCAVRRMSFKFIIPHGEVFSIGSVTGRLCEWEWPPQHVDMIEGQHISVGSCLLYTSPSPRDRTRSRMPSSA
eukprot:TRINITY_DN6860_c0_g1_i1.p1 TRINITY_DN6860_c0_g1~~TRINITY_DN6860_c0_g1_i1.p1  ORF type:complete len:101 (-),score=24.25 TRINITY_DN6860_c0_g1_i1:67-369(-)